MDKTMLLPSKLYAVSLKLYAVGKKNGFYCPAVCQLWTTKVMETKVTAMGLPILTWIIKHPNCNFQIHINKANVKHILEDKMKTP